jgi:hypothetical protein
MHAAAVLTGVDAAKGEGAHKGIGHDLEGQRGEGRLVSSWAAHGNLPEEGKDTGKDM